MMEKRILKVFTISIILLIMVLGIYSTVLSEIIFFDNFETHEGNQYPTGEWWYELYSGVSAKISTNYTYGSSPHSFRLEGLSNWSRIDGINISYDNEITYQTCIYIPNSQKGAMVGFFKSQGNMAPSYNAIIFRNDGKICLRDSGLSDIELQSYNAEQWYIVTVSIDFFDNRLDVYINGENKYSGIPRSERTNCSTFALETNNFSTDGTAVAYFDNVAVLDNYIPTNTVISTFGNIGSFAYDWYYSQNRNRDGRYAETRLDIPSSVSDFSEISLSIWNWYSQASGSAHCKVYMSTDQQVTPTDNDHDLITWWVGNTVDLGNFVGEYDAVNTISLLTLDVKNYIQLHPSEHYYIAIKNEGNADAAAYGIYLTAKTSDNCLYIVNTPDQTISDILHQLKFNVTTSTTIPANLSSYDLVICREYSACTPSTASYISNYVKNGGGAILMGGTPSTFCGGGYSCSDISEWFGTSQYSNVDVSYAKIAFDNPLGTSLMKHDVIEECTGWGGAAVTDVNSDATILAEWDYGSDNIHSFIRSYQNGRVGFWAGGSSYNSNTSVLFNAVCKWVSGKINITSVEREKRNVIPKYFSLMQNYPNPFNPATTIEYNIRKLCHVKLSIYSVLGEEIKILVNKTQSPGNYSIIWDGTNKNGFKVTSGIYFYRIQIDGMEESLKLNLIK
ncbi:MAG: FlgD immunoglobulin-like domain containing protein [bacterium]